MPEKLYQIRYTTKPFGSEMLVDYKLFQSKESAENILFTYGFEKMGEFYKCDDNSYMKYAHISSLAVVEDMEY